jgi:hypothetical protein
MTEPMTNKDIDLRKVQELRDELRVQMHLAGMEAKDKWLALEERAEKLVRHAGRASRNAIAGLRRDFEELMQVIRETRGQPHA